MKVFSYIESKKSMLLLHIFCLNHGNMAGNPTVQLILKLKNACLIHDRMLIHV